MLRSERVKLDAKARRVPIPPITAGEKLLAVFLAQTQGQTIVPESVREITDLKDGAAWLPAGLEGTHEVLFFISSRTGMQVKRPAVGAEGYVLNHLDRAAAENYLKPSAPILRTPSSATAWKSITRTGRRTSWKSFSADAAMTSSLTCLPSSRTLAQRRKASATIGEGR
jgi:hypothetical protein